MSVVEAGTVGRQGTEFFKESVNSAASAKLKPSAHTGKENAASEMLVGRLLACVARLVRLT